MTNMSCKTYVLVSLLFSILSAHALAACAGAASPAALSSFEDNPAAWLTANGKSGDLGPDVSALAAAAVNSKDRHFGKALNAMLGRASADQGTAVGTALGTLGSSCSDPRDPNDTADKQYIALHIIPNLRANGNANAAYAEANGSGRTAGDDGGGEGSGVGGGVGGQTGTTGFASGGSNSGGSINAPTGAVLTSESRLTTFGASGASTASGALIVSPH